MLEFMATLSILSHAGPGGCGAVKEGEAQASLLRLQACGRSGVTASNLNAIQDLDRTLNTSAETRYIAVSAQLNARELKCAGQFAHAIGAGDAAGVNDVVAKLKVLRAARSAWVGAIKELRADPSLVGRMCPTFLEELQTLDTVPPKFREICTRVIKQKSAAAMVEGAIPLGTDDRVRKLISTYQNSATPESDADLEKHVKDAYAEAGRELQRNSDSLSARLAAPGGAKFSNNEIRALIADPLLVKEIVDADKATLEPVARCADLRYGERGDAMMATVTLGSLALGGAATATFKAATWGARLARAAMVARTAGQISLGATRMFQGAALAATAATAYREIARVCGSRKITVTAKAGACSSAPSTERRAQDNCLLSSMLSSLDVASTLPAGSLAMLAPALKAVPTFHPATMAKGFMAAPKAFYEERARERLGYVPRLEIDTHDRLGGTGNDIKAFDKSGKEIGDLTADTDGDKIKLVWYETTDKAALEKGVSGVMFAKFIETHPNQKIVSAELDFTNAEIVRELAKKMPCEDAVLASPAGKMLGRFGYKKLLNTPDCAARIFVDLSR